MMVVCLKALTSRGSWWAKGVELVDHVWLKLLGKKPKGDDEGISKVQRGEKGTKDGNL